MKLLSILLTAAVLAGANANPGLKAVHTVYLLPMAGGLDQLLAVRLNKTALFEVVTDPAKADAVFTEQIGASFEARFKELFESKEEKAAEAKEDVYIRPAAKPMGQTKGSVFLVDRKTGNVIWSIYQKPSYDGSDVKNRANRVGDQLQKDLKGK
jgi:hypothetical protein